jgi:hypothetical protein
LSSVQQIWIEGVGGRWLIRFSWSRAAARPERKPVLLLPGRQCISIDDLDNEPYSRMDLGHDERILNYRLSRARVVENASEYWPTNFNVCFMQQFIRKHKVWSP